MAGKSRVCLPLKPRSSAAAGALEASCRATVRDSTEAIPIKKERAAGYLSNQGLTRTPVGDHCYFGCGNGKRLVKASTNIGEYPNETIPGYYVPCSCDAFARFCADRK